MLIYPLWLTNYSSGTGDDFFKKSFEALGHEVSESRLDHNGCEVDLLERLEKRKADLIFHVPYTNYFRNEIMDEITRQGNNTMAWQGDDEWLWSSDNVHSPKFISHAHKWNVTTCSEAVPKYKKIGITPILAQWGYSASEWKYKNQNRDIDVYFCGARNPERDKLLKRISGMELNYSFDGPGYGYHKDKKNQSLVSVGINGRPIQGKVSFQDMVNKYQRAKISVSLLMGSGKKEAYTQVKQRVFEIPASGSFQLASRCPELERFFHVGKEIDVFDTEDELEDKINFYLKHDVIRERMAKRAMFRNSEYSYEKIFQRIFKEVGL